MSKICILGAGSWGTAQAILLSKNAHQVTLWGRREDNLDIIRQERENKRFLPGVTLPESIELTTSLSEAIADASLIVLAVPSQALRSVAKEVASYLGENTYLVNTAKGLEIQTAMRMSQVVEEVLGQEIKERYAVLSGPSHAEEVAREVPTVVTVAAYRRATATYVQDIYMSPVFRVYTNPDVPGVELGGALKNIVALATGIAHGLGYGDNTKAALITRGLIEIIRMGEEMGGNALTFAGLSGIGDLIVTCGSQYSRNRRAGELIGSGHTIEETLEKVGMVVEGAHAIKVVNRLAQELSIEMPITRACYNILYDNHDAREEVHNLMMRRKKHEIEEIVKNIKDW